MPIPIAPKLAAATTPEERERQVIQANASQALEGFVPDESDKKIQAAYISGTASVDDLLQHAKNFVDESRGKIAKT